MTRFYAIKYKDGKSQVVNKDWGIVEPMVKGKKGVTFKGFSSKKDAEKWINKASVSYRSKNTPYENDVVYIFVDGSYSPKRRASGWGWVAVENDIKIGEGYGVKRNLGKNSSRNIVGELLSTIKAVEWIQVQGLKDVIIVHDYSGIANWALDYWEARSQVAFNYKSFMVNKVRKLRIKFEKVGGHSGIKWNDYADELTRKYQLDSGEL